MANGQKMMWFKQMWFLMTIYEYCLDINPYSIHLYTYTNDTYYVLKKTRLTVLKWMVNG